MAIKMTLIEKEKTETIKYPCLIRGLGLSANRVYLAFNDHEGVDLISGEREVAHYFRDREVYKPFTGKIELENE